MKETMEKAALLESPEEQEQYLTLPCGLMGFPDIREVEVVYAKDEIPFLRLREVNSENEAIEFVVVEPYGLFSDYEVEISTEDMEYLDIKSEEDVYLLNVVCITNEKNVRVDVNLVAPIVFNKKTFVGKQIIINNFFKYSTNYVLYSERGDSKNQ